MASAWGGRQVGSLVADKKVMKGGTLKIWAEEEGEVHGSKEGISKKGAQT